MEAERSWKVLVAGLALALAPLAGCSKQERSEAKEDAREAVDDAEDALESAEQKARDAADKAGEGLEKAGDKAGEAVDKAGEAVEEAGEKLDAAKQTLDIKAALMAQDGLDASDIEVDTHADTKTVVLSGTVPSTAQKTTAGRVAKDKAQGYAVENRLTVAARRRTG